MILTKQQSKLKTERDIKRNDHISKIGNRKQRIIKKSGNSGNGSAGSVAVGGSGSSGSAFSSGLWITNTIYLKPTQVGLDCFSSISKYPVADFSGSWETYNKIAYIEIRMGTSTAYDSASFDSAWDSGTQIFIEGSESNMTNEYSYGSYKQLSPTLTSGYSYQQLMRIKFLNPAKTHWTLWYMWSNQVSIQTLSTPSISFSQTNNEFTISGANSGTSRVVEFNRDGYTPYSSYLTSVEKDICYNCSVRNQEYGIYSGQAQQSDTFALWNVGTYTVKLTYASGHPSDTRTRFSNAVNNWISQMNSAIVGSGVIFTRDDSDSSPDILIETQSNTTIGSSSYIGWDGYPVGYTYGGLWENYTNSDGWINYAYIRLNYETQYYDTFWCSVESITTEELTQACGCGGDLTTRADCINSDFNWYGKGDGNFNAIDSHIQNFLYNSNIYIAVGGGSAELAVLMNPSNGFMNTFTNVTPAYWMTQNTTYNMRVWQANSSDQYSVVPAYNQTFTTPAYPQQPGSPSITSRINNALELIWTAGDNADKYRLAYSIDNIYWTEISNITSNTYTFYGQYGRTYYLKVRSESNNPYDNVRPSDYSPTVLGTTNPSKPIFMEYVQAGITHTIDIGFLRGSSNSGYTVTTDIDWTKSLSDWGGVEYISQSGTFYNIDVLDWTTTYFRLRAQMTVSGVTLYSDWTNVITVVLNNRPSNWSWSYSILSGGSVYNVINKDIFIMSYTEWNSFCTKINAFRTYKGLSAYSFTTVSTNTELTLTILNQALTAIRDMSAYFTGGNSVPSNRVIGDNILVASYYTNMRDALNSIA